MKLASDDQLVSRAVAGDNAAFAELVDRYTGKVLGCAARFTDGRHELDDLSQDIFLQLWKNLSSYQRKAPFEHWLMKVTIRKCYDHLRKYKRIRENEVNLEWQVEAACEQDVAKILDAHRLVHSGLKQLKAKERLVLTLFELEDFSVQQVAELTGWRQSNVKVIAFRARKRLKELLERRGYESIE